MGRCRSCLVGLPRGRTEHLFPFRPRHAAVAPSSVTEGTSILMKQMTGPSSTAGEPPSPERPRSKLRQRLELSWVISIVLFTLARFFVARETLEQYGLNIWVF